MPFQKLIDQAYKKNKHIDQDLNTITNRYIENSKPNKQMIHVGLKHTWNMYKK